MSGKYQAAIYDAIRCLPFDLTRLTTDYVYQRPHTWTGIAGSIDVVAPADADGPYDLKPIAPTDRLSGKWNVLVSSASLAVGRLEWTVDCRFGYYEDAVRIGVGVTTRSANGTCTDIAFSSITSYDWILFHDRFCNGLLSVHAGKINTIDCESAIVAGRQYRIVCHLDPVLNRIDATVQLPDGSNGPTVPLLTGIQDLTAVRPCIFIDRGSFGAVVWSV